MNMENLLKEWQDRLCLNDWVIKIIDNCPTCDFSLRDCAGECAWNEVGRSAIIKLVSSEEYGDRIVPYDKEKTLVHELLHIKFCFIDESENALQNRLLHRLVDEMAVALVKAKRFICTEENNVKS